jgi:serine/threonine-protein kinase
MNATRNRVKSLFLDAVENCPPERWEDYLDEACGGDEDLRRRVRALLEAHLSADSFVEEPGPAVTVTAASPFAEGPGTVIGPYRLMEVIGEGGMGVVCVAEQTEPVRRRVALKVIKPGMDSKQVVARFEAERQALAMMDHPNIAKVHDGGTTDSGRPYFVMELVRGLPITEYCDAERLSIRQRLELFVLVCRAVQHAHQKGVIHRDLKPSNILVTLHDGVPVPKVIDFGVAKATGQALTDKTVYTAFTHLIGTPPYMSPERVELSGLDVDTRSDIYSLGVLLYELLTGTTPFDLETLRKAAFDEMRRIIREDEPPTPSTRLGSLGATLTTASAQRSSDPRHLNRTVRGELDWIVMKALEKDRRRRYETANEFASDVMRHLTDQPVEACPPSLRYSLGKMARRNRVALTTAALVVGALALGLAGSLVMAARAADAERRANAALGRVRDGLAEVDRQRARAREAVDQMYTQVAQKWLSREEGLTPLQRDFLEKALAFYDEFARERAGDPEARVEAARAAARVGEIRSELGQSAGALESHLRALGIFRLLAAEFPDRPEYRRGVAERLRDVGLRHESLGRTQDAERAFREAVALRERLAEDPGTPDDRADLASGSIYLGRLLGSTKRVGDGERLLVRSIDSLTKLVEQFPKEAGYRRKLDGGVTSLGILYSGADRTAEAESQFRRSVRLRQEMADADPTDPEPQRQLAMACHNLGHQLGRTHRPREAVAEYRRALPIEEKLAADHPERPGNRALLAQTLGVLSEALVNTQQFDEAEKAVVSYAD